ncbi:MAG: beta-ketoacyl-[acyl-carrier-protein] synthase family protein [Candidatus Omnitrophica bacterium]|nr:beta-ketoacyl-[acyl-carrier-protein] synthase family protein [Candidatus Omnitrophota bacterium]
MSEDRRVVVTGLGVVSSIGTGKEEFWNNLLQGESGIAKVESFDTTDHFTHLGGEVKGFAPEEFIDRRKVKLMGRATQFACAAAKLAFEDARLKLDKPSKNRIAVCLGTTGGEAKEIESINAVWVKDGLNKVDKRSISKYPMNNISSNVARELKAKGPNRLFTTACAAGNYAIGYGFDLLKLGKADLAVVGGSEAFSYISFTGFNQLRITASEMCQPFDKNRKGLLVGEGSAILILETLDQAIKRGAYIYAEILGYGLSCDASNMVNPDTAGMVQGMRRALGAAKISADEVDYVSAHGTGTRNNDKAECAAIKSVFDDRKLAVSSIKSMLGHTMGASSAIEAITCCLVVGKDIIPPTINYRAKDSECDIDCVPNRARKQRVNIAINNAFAFGGNNSCLVIKKFVS